MTEIKEVTSRDLKKIVALEHQIFKKDAFSKKWIHQLINNNTFFLKMETGRIIKELIGFIIVIRDSKNKANIINFLIKTQYQNKGYGSYLLQETLKRIAKLQDIKKIILNVQTTNLIAINLYEKFNFKKNPTLVENYYQSGESAFLMELNLDSL